LHWFRLLAHVRPFVITTGTTALWSNPHSDVLQRPFMPLITIKLTIWHFV